MDRVALRLLNKIPSQPQYFARLFGNGMLGFYLVGLKGAPKARPGDPLEFYESPGFQYDMKPERQEAAEELVRLGLFEKRIKETGAYQEITFKYRKPGTPSALWKSEADVPKEDVQYGWGKHSPIEDSILVDTYAKTVDLDTSWTRYMNRRPGAGGSKTKTYVIPSGDVAFGRNNTDLKKVLYQLLKSDSRVLPNFVILGDERYLGWTIADVLGQPRDVDVALGNIPRGESKLRPIYAYHGTSTARWKEGIKAKGLHPGKYEEAYVDLVPGYSEKNIYLTFNVSEAENYATRASIMHGGKPLVLKVQIPDLTRIIPDEDAMRLWIPLSRPYEIKKNPRLVRDWGDQPFKEISQKPEIIKQISYTEALSWMIRKQEKPWGAEVGVWDRKDIVVDDEFKRMLAELEKSLPKFLMDSLRGGTFAYRGWIPPKFIKPFREYTKTRYPGNSEMLEFEDYQRVRKQVQEQMKRYVAGRVLKRYTSSSL